MFHGVFVNRVEGVPDKLYFGMQVGEFEKVLQWFKKENIKIITTDELLMGKPGLHLTFDDGYANNYEVALPLLKKYNFPAIVFITTKHLRAQANANSDFLDVFQNWEKQYVNEHGKQLPRSFLEENWNALTTEQFKLLAASDLIEIGCHTHTHPKLPGLTYEQQLYELSHSKAIIEEVTGKTVKYFSYPFGLYNADSIKAVSQLGFKAAFAVVPHNIQGEYKYQIPRIGMYGSSPFYLSSKLSFYYMPVNSKKL
ncbi:MAG TPA: polysaccharide deacetylase family protein [Bacteroidia bacterium]|nr:polysaccharide deacetylase family protein [Bacteroidia bacterium]